MQSTAHDTLAGPLTARGVTGVAPPHSASLPVPAPCPSDRVCVHHSAAPHSPVVLLEAYGQLHGHGVELELIARRRNHAPGVGALRRQGGAPLSRTSRAARAATHWTPGHASTA